MPLRFVIAIAETPTTMPHTGDKFIQGAITHCYTQQRDDDDEWNGIKFALRNHYNPINALNQHANNNSTYFSNNTTGHERVRQQRNPQTIIIIIIIAVDLLLLLSLSQDFVQRNNMQQAVITDFVVPLRRSRLAITSEIIPFLRLPQPVLMNVTLPFAMLLLRILSILFKPLPQNMLTTWLAYVPTIYRAKGERDAKKFHIGLQSTAMPPSWKIL